MAKTIEEVMLAGKVKEEVKEGEEIVMTEYTYVENRESLDQVQSRIDSYKKDVKSHEAEVTRLNAEVARLEALIK